MHLINYSTNDLMNHSLYVTLDHKTSHKGQFFEILIYTSLESFPLMYVWTIFVNLESEDAKKSKY